MPLDTKGDLNGDFVSARPNSMVHRAVEHAVGELGERTQYHVCRAWLYRSRAMVVLSAATDNRDSATLRRNKTLAASRR